MEDSPHYKMESKTQVYDRERHRMIMSLDGVALLPPGSLIELADQNGHTGTAIVKQIRLVPGDGDRMLGQVWLDCDVEDGWWPADIDENLSPAARAAEVIAIRDGLKVMGERLTQERKQLEELYREHQEVGQEREELRELIEAMRAIALQMTSPPA